MSITLRTTTSEPTIAFAVGTSVDVRNRFVGSWSRGFEIAGQVDDGYLIRRLSDGSILPDPLAYDEVRAAESPRRQVASLLQAVIAFRHDDGGPTHDHPFDTLGRTVRARVNQRRPLDLGSLAYLDLVAERDPAVTSEMDRERPRSRAGRRILGNAEARGEHPGLPSRT